ncbi:HNH endonuclease signature motif containing protein [Rhodococcus yananensis]|uniref:HNH endonuclease signature motif containing protein n=1 Tax=Rhodococcus yananensis TaxID=2879464 RepID=UPI001CF86665|nr:HNH endonuclease signature motif containing protein [Rhodococcus yananensis]
MHSEGGVLEQIASLRDAVAALSAADLTALSDTAVLDALRDLEATRRMLAGVDHTLVVQLTERKLHTQHGVRSPQRLLVDILRVSRRDAAERVQAARLLGHWHRPDGSTAPPKHPATAAAVADGEASAEHARVVSKILHKLPESVSDEKRTEAEQTLAELARTATPEDILNAGHHLLAHLDPDGSLTDERDRRRRRSVYLRGQGADLMSRFSGELDPTARAMFDVILAKWARPGMNNPADPDSPTGDCDAPSVNRDALVAAAARDTRTAAQRNHDAFAAMCRFVVETGVLGRHRGLPATVIITMSLDQLEKAAGVATTATGGTLPIKDALALAEHAHPVLALFDHTGKPLHLGRGKRLANVDQRFALIAWQRGCTRPGCSTPAAHCAVHHQTEWERGGGTDIENLSLACDACHALVTNTDAGWTTAPSPRTGRPTWTAPVRIDPERRPRVNIRHHPEEILRRARSRIVPDESDDP